MIQHDLFGHPIKPQVVIRKGGGLRKIGYAAKPGTGPRNKRCCLCVNYEHITHSKGTTPKCHLMADKWTEGSETDIHPNAPACSLFQPKPFKPMLLLSN